MDDPRDTEAARRERAYAIWEREGRPDDRHNEHWDEAGRDVDPSDVPAPPATPPSGPASAEDEHPIPAPDAKSGKRG